MAKTKEGPVHFRVGTIATRAGGKRLEAGRAYEVSADEAKDLVAAKRGEVVSRAEAEKINQAADKAAAETQAKAKAGAKSEG